MMTIKEEKDLIKFKMWIVVHLIYDIVLLGIGMLFLAFWMFKAPLNLPIPKISFIVSVSLIALKLVTLSCSTQLLALYNESLIFKCRLERFCHILDCTTIILFYVLIGCFSLWAFK